MVRTKVAIVGGGPSGLILAIELGRRGIPCVLLEEDATPPTLPKANATTSRTMEHYRRLGFAAEIRALGLPEDYPQDIAYFTRYTGHELARLRGRSRREAIEAREGADSRWPTPEPLHRVQQMYIEAILKRQAEKWPAADVRFGWRALGLEQRAESVRVEAENVATGRTERLAADFAVGCDGPRSLVRSALGVGYEGLSREERDFMGGRMLAVYIRSRAFYDVARAPRAWQYWAMNREQRALMNAIDGRELWVLHVQLPRDGAYPASYARESLVRAAGREFPFEVLGIAEWTAGFTLVAERFGGGRAFIAGDAAHLFTPTGGQGYNTSVDDASNLAWKLAAACQGWGGAGLLATYEAERKPIALRNTRFARAMAESIGRIELAADLEEDGEAGEAARAALGERLVRHAATEFDIPGIHLGVSYAGSPIVVPDGTPPPGDDWHHYTPNAVPGARAPHAWLKDGVSVFDRFGRDFTLLRFDAGIDARPLEAAARRRGVPLSVIDVSNDEARDLYGRDLALIRPDHHVAWRGNALPEDASALLAGVTGHVQL
ncbi:MAG TPA: FAD-dependent oxidoreductase [Burkholderiales bacterium]|nr:FAD-dependent oxidoreductase [Burkholderiales bacterium]